MHNPINPRASSISGHTYEEKLPLKAEERISVSATFLDVSPSQGSGTG